MNRPRCRVATIAAAIALAGGFSSSAQAVDGCKVLLCMAGNWRNIAACVPEVTRALRDLARGRVIPQCRMASVPAGAAGAAGPSGFTQYPVWGNDCPHYFRSYRWQDDPQQANPAYRSVGGWLLECEFDWAVQLTVNGQPWKRIYTGPSGALEEWQPAARSALGLGDQAIEVDARERAWRAAGSPKGPPPTPEGFLRLIPDGYMACQRNYAFGDGSDGSVYVGCQWLKQD